MYSKSIQQAFAHDEYHYYVTDLQDSPIHFHITPQMIADMKELMCVHEKSDLEGSWLTLAQHHLKDGFHIHFNPEDPDLSTIQKHPFRGMGEIKRVCGFNPGGEKVWVNSNVLRVSTGPPADKKQHMYKEIREDVILPEHEDMYMEKLIEDEEKAGWDTDWIER